MSQTRADHIMVDIETLDTEESAVILSIGACVITRDKPRPAFYGEIAVLHQIALGRTTSEATEEWWSNQGGCPRNGTSPLDGTLTEFAKWIATQSDNPIIWAKGIDFDTKILAHAYKMCQLPVPWKYNSVRDFRTVKKLFEESITSTIFNANPHNALADAEHQADQLLSIELALR